MNRTVAVVVTCNRLALLQQNIECLRKQSLPCSILVVDNASTDGTAACLESMQTAPNFLTVRSETNLGGSGGFNLGMRKAAEAGFDYIWIMDDDCMPEPDALAELLRADAALGGPEHYGFLSSRVLWKDGSDCVMNRQKRAGSEDRDPALAEQGIVPVLQATFVSLLFPRGTVESFGLPIRDFFIWGDDIEYTRRIAVRGACSCYLAERSRVVHLTKNNVGSNIGLDEPGRIDRYYYAFRNEFYLHRAEGAKGMLLYFGKRCRDVLRILFLAKGQRIRRFRVLFRGMRDGLRFRPEVEYLNDKR